MYSIRRQTYYNATLGDFTINNYDSTAQITLTGAHTKLNKVCRHDLMPYSNKVS